MEHPKGESPPDKQRVYRPKVVRTFLSTGVVLNKMPEVRDLLEENAFHLTDRRWMSDTSTIYSGSRKRSWKRI